MSTSMSALDPRLERSFFIAGTDTGVGKTWVTARLLRAWVRAGHRAVGMKPVAAGAVLTSEGWRNEDALSLQAAGNVALPYEWVNPVCLPRPTSPHLAASEVGVNIDIESIERVFNNIVSATELIAVEGAGGWYAPLTAGGGGGEAGGGGTKGPAVTMADLAQRLGLPVLLVVGLRLGCLSHALLTAEAIARCSCELAGWIANPIDAQFADRDAAIEWLGSQLPAPRLVVPEH